MKCNYCPYIVLENSTRTRDAEAVVEEMRQGIGRWGFRSFKFRDPLFGLHRKQVFELAERIARLPRKIQFSIETRTDLLSAEVLRLLRDAGLSSVTVGMESPDGDHAAPPPPLVDRRRPAARIHSPVPRPGHPHRGRLPHRFSPRHRGVDPAGPRVRPATQPDLRQLQRGHAVSGHGLFRADARPDRRQPTSATTRSTRRC